MAWLLLLLTSIALLTAGLAGYAIFGLLSYQHQADRGRLAGLGGSAFSGDFLRWLLRRDYAAAADPRLSQLATPARLLALTFLLGAAGFAAALLWSALR